MGSSSAKLHGKEQLAGSKATFMRSTAAHEGDNAVPSMSSARHLVFCGTATASAGTVGTYGATPTPPPTSPDIAWNWPRGRPVKPAEQGCIPCDVRGGVIES